VTNNSEEQIITNGRTSQSVASNQIDTILLYTILLAVFCILCFL